MPETVHVYITVILSFVLAMISALCAWLVKSVIANQERIAVLTAVMGDVGRQLGEIKSALSNLDTEMNSGLEKIHTRINTLWREGRGHGEER